MSPTQTLSKIPLYYYIGGGIAVWIILGIICHGWPILVYLLLHAPVSGTFLYFFIQAERASQKPPVEAAPPTEASREEAAEGAKDESKTEDDTTP
ncbi:Hypothetical protein PBC10988_20270 [Planctomycetales bacterium 10988]|nr:Hypothetical protein PBC10988_20270 [Planctomycetales bacterium 10988]